jgi:hypothetical protein
MSVTGSDVKRDARNWAPQCSHLKKSIHLVAGYEGNKGLWGIIMSVLKIVLNMY